MHAERNANNTHLTPSNLTQAFAVVFMALNSIWGCCKRLHAVLAPLVDMQS